MPTTMEEGRCTGDFTINGSLKPTRPRTELTREQKTYPFPMDRVRIWDAVATILTGTANTDDLGYTSGAFGTNVPKVTAGDIHNTTGTRYGRFLFEIPPEYIAGDTLTLRFSAATETNVATTSSTVDAEVYKSNRGGVQTGGDLCTTAATSINATSFANKDFTINPATLSPGDILDIRIALIWNDATAASVVQPSIGAIEFLAMVQG